MVYTTNFLGKNNSGSTIKEYTNSQTSCCWVRTTKKESSEEFQHFHAQIVTNKCPFLSVKSVFLAA